MSARPALSREDFAQKVGFDWRSLKPIVTKHGIGLHLHGRWRFTDDDVKKTEALMKSRPKAVKSRMSCIEYLIAFYNQHPKDYLNIHGTVYIIQGKQTKRIKIGYSRDARQRFDAIQACSPDELKILCLIPAQKSLEAELHNRFFSQRLHGEWFQDCDEIRAYASREKYKWLRRKFSL